MEIYEIAVEAQKKVSVLIERKKMKTCRLKVFPDSTVKFSVPYNASKDWIAKYLTSKVNWITVKLKNFETTKGYAATTEVRTGVSIRFLGEDLIFSVHESCQTIIYKEGKHLYVYSSDISDQAKLLQQFEKWWRQESLKVLELEVDKLYPIIKKYKMERPKIMLRKMKTLWGSCSASRGIVTFNQYLTKAKPACIEYVVLHELVHFLYPNHSKQFYNFLSNYMPDWKDRKKVLDQDVVHGL